MHDYLEARLIKFNGTYFQLNVYRIAGIVSNHYNMGCRDDKEGKIGRT